MTYVIEYDYPGTANGKPVGRIFAMRLKGRMRGLWSYTRDASKATKFPTEEAAEETARGKPWPRCRIVEIP